VTDSDSERSTDLRNALIQMPRRPGEAAAPGSEGQRGWFARCSAAVQGAHDLAAELAASLAPGQDAADALNEVLTWPGEVRGAEDHRAEGPLLSAACALLDVVLAVENPGDAGLPLLKDAITRWRWANVLPTGPAPALGEVGVADPRVARVLESLIGLTEDPAAGYVQLVVLALAGELQPTVARVHVSVVFGYGQGSSGKLGLRVQPGGPAGLYPDPQRMAFFSADEEFADALSEAWATSPLSIRNQCVLWDITDNGRPVEPTVGGSLGAAFGVGLHELRRSKTRLSQLSPRSLDSRCAITGGLDRNGILQPVGDYEPKFQAALKKSWRRIIVPENDPEARKNPPKGLRVDPAPDLKTAIRKSRRLRRRPLGIISMVAILLLASGAAVLAARSGEGAANTRAAQQHAAALAGELATLSGEILDTHLNTAQLLAVEATQVDNDPQARAALFRAATASPHLERFVNVGKQVTAIAASADGDIVVAGTSSGDLVRFDLGDGSRKQVAAGDRPIADVAVSADGTTVAADNGTQAFSWATGGHSPTLLGVPGSASSVAVSPSGRLVTVLTTVGASSESGGTPALAVWNLSSRTMVKAVASSPGQVAFTSEATLINDEPDGAFQEYASSDLRLLSQQPADGTPANGYTYGMSPDGAYSGYIKYGDITAWSNAGPGAGQQVPLAGTAPAERASYLTFSDDGTLAASIDNGTITVSPLTNASASTQLTGTVNTSAVTFLAGDDRLVSAAGSTLALWNLAQDIQVGGPTDVPVAASQVASTAVRIAMSPDDRYLAIADGNLEPGAANMSPNGQILPVVSLYRNGPTVTRVRQWEQSGAPVWSGDQLLLVSLSASEGVQVARAGGPVLASWPYHSGPLLGELPTASYISSNEILIPDGTGVISFDPKTGTGAFHPVQLAGLPHFSYEYVAAISPDGTAAILVGSSNTSSQSVIYVDLRSGGFRVMEPGQIGSVLFTRNRLLVQDGGAIQEWDPSGQHRLQTLPANGSTTYGLTVSSDGTMLAQVDNNGVASITDLATDQPLDSFDLPISASPANVPAGITTMTFSPDGQYLLTATPGDVLSRWDIGEATLVKIACTRAGQSLTSAIWASYVPGPTPPTLACTGESTNPTDGTASAGGTAAIPATSPATPSAAPGPSSITGGSLYRVAVVSATDAWAVGDIGNKTGLIMHWDGQAWHQVPTPAGLRNFLGVTALSANDVWAVGYDSTDTAVILRWDGAAWATSLTLGKEDSLTGLGASFANDIWAVGSSASGGLAVHWDGTAWQQVPIPVTKDGGLVAVTVVSADDAWAVGGTASGKPEIVHWNGTSWQQVPEPTLTGYSGLNDVASGSASDVWAVGGDGTQSIIEHWNGTAWQLAPSPPAGGNLGGITAFSANDAWAVGMNSGGRTVILHWNGHAWSQVSSPGDGSGPADLSGVAAVTAENAWAVGSDGSYPLILHWNGTRWNLPLPQGPNAAGSARNHALGGVLLGHAWPEPQRSSRGSWALGPA
jgi:WD40 repeat protein